MYSFLNDYSETAHPRILQAIADTNMVQCPGYGTDEHTQTAVNYIRQKFNAPDADVYFISGGTQTNLIAIAAFLRCPDGIICAESAHIETLETGAIEACGHKMILEPTADGKLTPANIEHALTVWKDDFSPNPAMVYISNTTELGTVYSRQELKDLYDCCKKHDLIFYIDGARIGSALTCSDLKMEDYSQLCDAFYIGGTKNGAMIGEAVVILRDDLKKNFRRVIKQRGALLAKGRILGIQFEELFRDDLFLELAQHATDCMDIIREGIRSLGYSFLAESPSNQAFPIFPKSILDKIETKYVVTYHHDCGNGMHCVRLCSSWGTVKEQCVAFVEDLKRWTEEEK